MIFEIRVDPLAIADMDDIHAYIGVHSQQAADRTYGMLKQAILGLSEFPERYAMARESAKSSIKLRQVIAGNYRIIYAVLFETVHVYRVLHAAQGLMNPADLF